MSSYMPLLRILYLCSFQQFLCSCLLLWLPLQEQVTDKGWFFNNFVKDRYYVTRRANMLAVRAKHFIHCYIVHATVRYGLLQAGVVATNLTVL